MRPGAVSLFVPHPSEWRREDAGFCVDKGEGNWSVERTLAGIDAAVESSALHQVQRESAGTDKLEQEQRTLWVVGRMHGDPILRGTDKRRRYRG